MTAREDCSTPIGIEYDPDAWLAKLRASTLAYDFLAREGDLSVSPIYGAQDGRGRALETVPGADKQVLSASRYCKQYLRR